MTINPTYLAQRTRSCTFSFPPFSIVTNCFNVSGQARNGGVRELTHATVNRLAASWNDAKYRVLKSYREWLRAVSLSLRYLLFDSERNDGR